MGRSIDRLAGRHAVNEPATTGAGKTFADKQAIACGIAAPFRAHSKTQKRLRGRCIKSGRRRVDARHIEFLFQGARFARDLLSLRPPLLGPASLLSPLRQAKKKEISEYSWLLLVVPRPNQYLDLEACLYCQDSSLFLSLRGKQAHHLTRCPRLSHNRRARGRTQCQHRRLFLTSLPPWSSLAGTPLQLSSPSIPRSSMRQGTCRSPAHETSSSSLATPTNLKAGTHSKGGRPLRWPWCI